MVLSRFRVEKTLSATADEGCMTATLEAVADRCGREFRNCKHHGKEQHLQNNNVVL